MILNSVPGNKPARIPLIDQLKSLYEQYREKMMTHRLEKLLNYETDKIILKFFRIPFLALTFQAHLNTKFNISKLKGVMRARRISRLQLRRHP